MQEIKYANVLYVCFVSELVGHRGFAFIFYTLFPSVLSGAPDWNQIPLTTARPPTSAL